MKWKNKSIKCSLNPSVQPKQETDVLPGGDDVDEKGYQAWQETIEAELGASMTMQESRELTMYKAGDIQGMVSKIVKHITARMYSKYTPMNAIVCDILVLWYFGQFYKLEIM